MAELLTECVFHGLWQLMGQLVALDSGNYPGACLVYCSLVPLGH